MLKKSPKLLAKMCVLASSPETLILLNTQPGDFAESGPGTTVLKHQSRRLRIRGEGVQKSVGHTVSVIQTDQEFCFRTTSQPAFPW